MTHNPELKPGPETDALVALAMGWTTEGENFVSTDPLMFPSGITRWIPPFDKPGVLTVLFNPPPFTTDDAAAMKALEWFIEDQGGATLYVSGSESSRIYDFGHCGIEGHSNHPVHALKMAVAEALIAAREKRKHEQAAKV